MSVAFFCWARLCYFLERGCSNGINNMFGLPDQAVGAVAAALIAGLISLLGLIISKEQKVSDFRQAWIDALRSDIAAVITHAQSIHGAYLAGHPSKAELWRSVREDFVGVNEAWARIRLRLNPKEEPSIAVLQVLKEHESVFQGSGPPDLSRLENIDQRLLDTTQAVLKKEWTRVRSGERTYRISKWSAIVIVVLSLLLLGWRVLSRQGNESEGRNYQGIFERRLRCRAAAEDYARKITAGDTIMTVERVDFSPSRESCIASTEEVRGFGTPHTYQVYRVIDLLSGESLFQDACNNNEPNARDSCGNGRDASIEQERNKGFDSALTHPK
jgi:hypothetical protein